jgi:hypothetical protein
MQVQYSKQGPRYVCRDAAMRYATSTCQSFGQRYLDEAVCACFFEAIKPAQLDTLLAALSTLEQERQVRERGWQLRLERARYAVRLAQRQYDAVDPENRLVARELEKRWNEALEALGKLEREYAVAQKTTLLPLTEEEQEAVRQLTLNVPAIWDAETTTMADRKRLLRTIIQEITLTPTAPRQATMTILWSGGVTTSHEIICPPMGWHCLAKASLVEHLRELASRLPDHQIAELLKCRRGAHTDRQSLDGCSCGQFAQAARHCHRVSGRTGSRRRARGWPDLDHGSGQAASDLVVARACVGGTWRAQRRSARCRVRSVGQLDRAGCRSSERTGALC